MREVEIQTSRVETVKSSFGDLNYGLDALVVMRDEGTLLHQELGRPQFLVQRIYLLTLGGTIEKDYCERTSSLHNLEPKIERYLRLLRLPDVDLQVTHLMNKHSRDMTDADRHMVLSEVRNKLSAPAPMVITHGTDTIVDTGLLIQREIRDMPVPIVLTGAMTPLGFEASDGLQNLTESLFAARILRSGVYIVMHNQVHPIHQVRKDHELSRFVLK